jgi:polysaccharide export outer membrane protein
MKALLLLFLMCCATALAQVGGGKSSADPLSTGQPYKLGPGDQITIRATSVEEISDKQFRIDSSGEIDLPLLGKVHPGGQTVDAFEADLFQRLGKYVRNPQVNVTVVQFRSQQVTFSGAFRAPGVYALQGRHTLTEMLSVAGGLDVKASRHLKISRLRERGEIPLPDVRLEANGITYVAELDTTMTDERSAADDFILQPFDVVTAKQGDPIYVSGEVAKVGALDLGDHKSLSMIQALSLCGGLTREASKHIKVYRPLPDSIQKKEIQVDLEKLLKGQEADLALLPKDLIVVPRNNGRAAAYKFAGIATGLAVTIFGGMALAGR